MAITGVRVMSNVILFLFLFAGFWCAIGFTVGYFVGKTNEVNNEKT